MKELLINAEDYHGFIDNVKKYVKKLLKASDYNYFIDEIMEVVLSENVISVEELKLHSVLTLLLHPGGLQ